MVILKICITFASGNKKQQTKNNRTMNFYKNGNYMVCIMNDGTKIRRTEEDDFIPSFAENVDVKLTDKCSMGCKFCFPEDVLIETPQGKKQISDIKKGDMVYSFNPLNSEFQIKPVDMLFCRNYEGELIEIMLEDNSIIKCTPNHKFYTTNRGWVAAENLTENDDILTF